MLYGGLESALPMDQSAQGRKLAARLPKPDASQRVSLAAVFGDVRIQRAGTQGAPAPQRAQDAKPFNDVITRAVPLPANAPLRIEAMTGDLRVEGIDGTETRITATRIVWMPSAAQAPKALEALGVTNDMKDGKLVVATKPTADLAAMGCSSYRVDLVVQCPRGAPIEIAAEHGLTRIAQLDGTINAAQAAGAIQAENMGGALTLNVEKGDIRVQQARGTVTANAKYGALLMQEIGGALNITATETKIIVEAARGPVTVRNTGGDVRILALDGIGGAFDVKVDNGLLSLVMGNKADASVHAIAQNGAVHSGVQLEGTITRTTQDFHARLLNGTHAVRLETTNGDILLD
jgi:hypothetical protein